MRIVVALKLQETRLTTLLAAFISPIVLCISTKVRTGVCDVHFFIKGIHIGSVSTLRLQFYVITSMQQHEDADLLSMCETHTPCGPQEEVQLLQAFMTMKCS